MPQSLPRTIVTKRQIKKLLLLPDTKTAMGFCDSVILEILYSIGIRRQELMDLRVQDCFINDRRLFIQNGNTQRGIPLGKLF